jgi:hypothetical protein
MFASSRTLGQQKALRLAKSTFGRTAVGCGLADAGICQDGERNRSIDRERPRPGFAGVISQRCGRCGADLCAGRDGRVMTWLHTVAAQKRCTNRPDRFGRQGIVGRCAALHADMADLPIRCRNGGEWPCIIREFGCACYAC